MDIGPKEKVVGNLNRKEMKRVEGDTIFSWEKPLSDYPPAARGRLGGVWDSVDDTQKLLS